MIKVVVAPTYDLLDEVKEFLRVIDADSDALIQREINSAMNFAENHTNRTFATTTFELYLPLLKNGLVIPKNPVQSITKIEYMDESKIYQILNADTYYLYEVDGLAKIDFSEIPNHIENKNAIRITFIAGSLDIPELIKSWLSIRVQEQFDGVESSSHKYVHNILNQYKISEF